VEMAIRRIGFWLCIVSVNFYLKAVTRSSKLTDRRDGRARSVSMIKVHHLFVKDHSKEFLNS
jgi:hypothetical protein